MNLHEFIKYGAIGLSGLLSVLIFYLIYKQSDLQTHLSINKSVNKGFTKMLYSFAGMCIFLSIIGYGSEIIHDYLTKKDLDAELAKANDKIEKLTDRVSIAERDAAVYKAIVDTIREQSSRTLNFGAKTVGAGGTPPNPTPPKATAQKIDLPFSKPKENRLGLGTDSMFKYNTKLILEGKQPLNDADYVKKSQEIGIEWTQYYNKLSMWLKEHPEQKQFYENH